MKSIHIVCFSIIFVLFFLTTYLTCVSLTKWPYLLHRNSSVNVYSVKKTRTSSLKQGENTKKTTKTTQKLLKSIHIVCFSIIFVLFFLTTYLTCVSLTKWPYLSHKNSSVNVYSARKTRTSSLKLGENKKKKHTHTKTTQKLLKSIHIVCFLMFCFS